MSSTSSGGQRGKDRPREDEAAEAAEVDEPTQERNEKRRERSARVAEDAEDILDDIDDALRASLGLDRDASDELFDEYAARQLAGYVQKGGQ